MLLICAYSAVNMFLLSTLPIASNINMFVFPHIQEIFYTFTTTRRKTHADFILRFYVKSHFYFFSIQIVKQI